MGPYLNDERRQAHKRRNLVQSGVLIVGMATLMGLCAFLLWSWSGVLWSYLTVGILLALSPRIPPEAVMRLFRAQPVDPDHGGQIYRIIEVIADRAELPMTPKLYVVPSMTLNAFATGRPEKCAIAITEGMLRKLNLRELAGVLAHEISHVHNNDLWIMSLADTMSRFTQIMSYTAIFMAIVNLPTLFVGKALFSWAAIGLLYLAPTVGSLLQLGLSRTREYDADLEGALLTGDPVGLASALQKLERYGGHFWEDLIFPGRRIPQPSLLRSHPPTEERIARLLELEGKPPLPPIAITEQPMVTLVGFGPIMMRPRFRWPGIWF